MAGEAGPAVNPIEQFSLSHVLSITVGENSEVDLNYVGGVPMETV